jgi:hypothetical protein
MDAARREEMTRWGKRIEFLDLMKFAKHRKVWKVGCESLDNPAHAPEECFDQRIVDRDGAI